MTSKKPRVPRANSLKPADDFKLIRGIGVALARRLHDADIHSFTQLASLSPDRLAAQVIGVSAKQIARQDWVGQANILVPKKARRKTRKKEKSIPTIRQHYENFTVEFLLDEKYEVRRSRVLHVQSGDADKWSGWEAEQMIDFLARHIGVHSPVIKSAPQEISVPHGQALPTSAKVELGLLTPKIAERVSPVLAVSDLAGTLHLRDLKAIPNDSDIPVFCLRQGQLFNLRLTLDLTEVVAPSDIPLVYKATIIVKELGGPRQLFGEVNSTLKLSSSATLGIAGTSLLPGIYRLDAFVRLTSDEAVPGLIASLKGGILQVY